MGTAAVLVVLLSSCKDLSVQNQNEPDRERALSSPEDVETLISGSFRTYYYAGESFEPNFALSVAADEISSSWGNFGMQDMGSEPRQPYNNDPSYGYSAVATVPFSNSYSAISAALEGLSTIDDGTTIGDEARTNRARAFAQFVVGISHLHIAVVHDQGFVVDHVPETNTFSPENAPFDIQPNTAVFEAGLQYLQQAIETAQNAGFSTIPEGWIGADAFSKEEFVGIIKMYRAHYRASMPRTPEERQNVDWQAVIDDIDEGYTEMGGGQNFEIVDTPQENWFSGIRYYGKNDGWTRVDLRTIGPADTTDAYENWLSSGINSRTPFEIQTPDKRIAGNETVDGVDYGKYMFQSGTAPFPQSRGIYHYSNRTYNRNWGTLTNYQGGNSKIIFTKATMRLLKAEALLQQNPTANKQQVIDLINESRVEAGELPAAQLTDPTGSMSDPQNPLRDDGATVWSMLKHEKRMESFGTACGIAFYDKRGWGDLVEGTPEDLPIPGEELEILEKALYTSDVVGGTEKASATRPE